MAGAGSLRGGLSEIDVNVLQRGDIFWLEEVSDPQKVYFVRTGGNFTVASDYTDTANTIDLTDGVVTGGSVSGTDLTLTRSVGDDVTITGLPSGGSGSDSTQLWTGDIAIGTANQWAAAGTDTLCHQPPHGFCSTAAP